MTIPALTKKQMLEILNANGYNTLSDKYWEVEGVERIVMGNGNHNFVLRLKNFYFFPEVIKRCQMLGIGYNDVPEHIKKEFNSCLKYWDAVEDYKKGIIGSPIKEENSEDDDEDDEILNKNKEGL